MGSVIRRVSIGLCALGCTLATTLTAAPASVAASPVLLGDPEIWGAEMEGDTLRIRRGRWQTDSPLGWDSEWLRCDSSGANCTPYVPTGSDTQVELNGSDVGTRWKVRVTATNASGSTQAVSGLTPTVVPTDAPESEDLPHVTPVPLGALAVPGVRLELDSVVASWYPWLGPTVERQWERCLPSGEGCTEITGANGSEYELGSADVGKRIRARVTSTNDSGSATSTSLPGAKVQALQAPVLEGSLSAPEPRSANDPWEGNHLDADNGEWGHRSGALSDRASEAGRTYEWLRCDSSGDSCTIIEGAGSEGRSYKMQQADIGSRLRARVTATNDAGLTVATSSATAVVLASQTPDVDAQPFDQDHIYIGRAVVGDYQLNTGAGEVDLDYQWKLCNGGGTSCADISGATGLAYVPTAAQEGQTLRFDVTAENRIGIDSDTSEASPAIELPPTPEAEEPPIVTPSPWGEPTLSPNPVAGKPLMADDDGIWSSDLVSAQREWQWQRCESDGTGCIDIPGAWSRMTSSYTPRWRDVGYRLRVRIARIASHGEAWATSGLTGVVGPGAPWNRGRPEIVGPPRVREYMWATAGEWTPEWPDLEFNWLRCDIEGTQCEEIPDAVWSDYLPSAADEGSTLRVRVIASNDEGSTSVESAPTTVVGPPAGPENVELPSIEGEAEIGATLYAGDGLWQGADPLEFHYRWLRCDATGEECEPIAGAWGWYYELTPTDAGSTVRLEVTVENDIDSASALSHPTAQLDPPIPPANVALPEVFGTAMVGETLDGSVGEWDNYPAEYDFQWRRCDATGTSCSDIVDATDDEYLLITADYGARIRLAITARNPGGQDVAISDATSTVGPMQPPANIILPRVSTRPEETVEVVATEGRWTGGQPLSFAYQWQRCNSSGTSCADITDADQATYTPVTADVDNRLKVKVVATNAAGSSNVISNAAQTTLRSPPRFDERVAIDGEASEDTELEALTDGLLGSAPIALSYTWQRCDSECESIAGADDDTYTLQAVDVGYRIRLRVDAENDRGEAVSKSPLSLPVEPADAEGAPIAVEPPRLSGLQRVTETVESTTGTWRGEAPIDTDIRWQRCGDTPVSCVDIVGATDPEYEVVAADEGHRLRTVVDAENTLDGASAVSILSPPIRPAHNTAFKLQDSATLDDVSDAIRLTGADWLTLDYEGSRGVGSYNAKEGATVDDVLAAIEGDGANPDGPDLPVTRFKLAGSVQTVALGVLASEVAGRLEVPSIRQNNDPSPMARLMSLDTPVVDDPFIQTGRIEGWGHECVGDDCDDVDEEEDWVGWGSTPPWPDHTRVLEAQFEWGGDTAEMLQRMYMEDRLFAWEHDVKLHNGDNAGLPWGIGCFPWETNNFWVGDRDDIHTRTSIPTEAGFYWDTDASDGCEIKDLTFGVYHPELLEEDEVYYVDIYFKTAGDEESSTVSWQSQLLERQPEDGNGEECDWDPWCVNVPPYNRVYEGETLIPSDLDLRLPWCWEYDNATNDAVDECVWDT